MRIKQRQGNTPQKTNGIIEDLVESQGDDSPVAKLRRMMIRMFNEHKEELKENVPKQLNEYQEDMVTSRRHRPTK
jgi:hypothetical protein